VLKRLVFCVVAIFLGIEAGALVLFNVPVVLNLPVDTWAVGLHWQLLALSVSNLVNPFLPYAYLLFIILGVLAFLLKAFPVTALVSRWRSSRLFCFFRSWCDMVEHSNGENGEPLSSHLPLAVAVLVSVAVSSFFVVITVLPWINPTYRLVSVDAASYYSYIHHMRGLDVNSALNWALRTDRPVFMVFLALLSYVVGPVNLVQFMPALLIPVWCVASVLLLRLFCPVREALIYTALLAPFSVVGLGLLYSGYFANLLAVVLVYAYFILLVKLFNGWSSLVFIALLGVSVLVLFVHLGTWFVFVASLGAFSFLECILVVQNRAVWRSVKWKVAIVGLTIAVGLVCDVVREALVPWSIASFVSSNIAKTFGFINGGFVLSGLRLTADFYLGGVFGLAPIALISIVGFVFMLRLKSVISNLLASWVFVSCVYMLFASDTDVFNRFLFIMPSLVFSGLGLSFIVRSAIGSVNIGRKRGIAEFLIFFFVLLVFLNFALNYIVNLNTL
ncbi:MAG TPA: hypothetical protein VMD05_07930, partial [Candidatus Nanoarchaeia archaeon]|nr:hypothetical protein [Candidatus Nanoarchaeia archaeon]